MEERSLHGILPYEYVTVASDPEVFVEAFDKLLEEGEKQGFTPVIFFTTGNDALYDLVTDDFKNPEDFRKDVMDESAAPEIIENHMRNCREYMEEMEDDLGDIDPSTVDPGGYEFPDFDNRNFATVDIYKIPTTKPYEIFAYLPFGGWNDCPKNHIHLKFAEKWYNKYKAVPLMITSDTIDYRVYKPIDQNDPNLKSHILEMIFYDLDLGAESMQDIADRICESKVWSFWWD